MADEIVTAAGFRQRFPEGSGVVNGTSISTEGITQKGAVYDNLAEHHVNITITRHNGKPAEGGNWGVWHINDVRPSHD